MMEVQMNIIIYWNKLTCSLRLYSYLNARSNLSHLDLPDIGLQVGINSIFSLLQVQY